LKIKVRIYEKNPSRSRTVMLNESDVMEAINLYLFSTNQISIDVACETEIDEVTI